MSEENHEREPLKEQAGMSDPTALTVSMILREISSLRDVVFTRLSAMDKATALFQEGLVRVPTDVQKAITALQVLIESELKEEHTERHSLQMLMDQKFIGVYDRFDENEKISEGVKVLVLEKFDGFDSKLQLRDLAVKEKADLVGLALTAALAASKESVAEQNRSSALAIAKSEASTIKTIDGLNAILQTSANATDARVIDLKERITTIESTKRGASATWGLIAGAIGLLLTVISVAIGVAVFFSRK